MKEVWPPAARFSKTPGTFPARKAIFSSFASKNGEVYTLQTSCIKRTFDSVKNTWIKQLCNHKAKDFAVAFRVRKLFGTFGKRAPGLTGIDFAFLLLHFSPQFLILSGLRRYIKHSRECFIGYPNTSSNFVKNTPLLVALNSCLGVWMSRWNTVSRVWWVTRGPLQTNHVTWLCSAHLGEAKRRRRIFRAFIWNWTLALRV